mgnify:FL=1
MHEPSTEVLLKARKFSVVRRSFTAPDGRAVQREMVEHPGAVAVIALLPDDRVCLIRNQRRGVGKTLVELPAGTLEPGEVPEACAARELAEETGYRAGKIEPLYAFWMSPGILTERMHLFLATELESGPQHLEADEQIETTLVTWEEALAMTADGRIEDAKTLVGLLLYDRLRRGR